jgi:hypothetical protein
LALLFLIAIEETIAVEMGSDEREADGEIERRRPGNLPATVAIPLGRLVVWLRWASGVAFLVVLAQWLVFGKEQSMSQGVLNSLMQQPDFNLETLDVERLRHGNSRLTGENGRFLGASVRSESDVEKRRMGGAPAPSSQGSSHGSAYGDCVAAHSVDKTLESSLCFLLACFFTCTLIDHCNLLVPFEWRFPISVVMFIFGGLLGLFFEKVTKRGSEHWGRGFDDLFGGLQAAAFMDPHALLYILLPPLLYESASCMDWHVLKKLIPSSTLMAVPGVVINTLLTGCFVKLVVRVGGRAPKWEESWLLGSILSATDPVAVVAALAALGAPKKLSTLVEGESLLNDGSAVVLAYVGQVNGLAWCLHSNSLCNSPK